MSRDIGREFTVAGKRYVWDEDEDGRLVAIPYAVSANALIDWAING